MGSNYKKKPYLIPIIIILIAIVAVGSFLLIAYFKNNQTDNIVNKNGGVVIVFEADVDDLSKISAEDMDAAETIIRNRLDSLNYIEAKILRQGKNRIRVEIPGVDNPQEAIDVIGATAKLEFLDADGNLIMDALGNIENAKALYGPIAEGGDSQHYVHLTFTSQGRKKFAKATADAVNAGPGRNVIHVALDGIIQMSPTVLEAIDSDICVLSGNYSQEEAERVAALINSGMLPFSLKETEVRSIAPQSHRQEQKSGGTVMVFTPDVDDLSAISEKDMDDAEEIILDILKDMGYAKATAKLQGVAGIRIYFPDAKIPQSIIEELTDILANSDKLPFPVKLVNAEVISTANN